MLSDYFFNTQHDGVLDGKTIFHHRQGTIGQTEVIDLYMECDDSGIIKLMRFKANGSPYLIAGAEWICRYFEQKNVKNLDAVPLNAIIEAITVPKTSISSLYRIREACVQLLAQWHLSKEIK